MKNWVFLERLFCPIPILNRVNEFWLSNHLIKRLFGLVKIFQCVCNIWLGFLGNKFWQSINNCFKNWGWMKNIFFYRSNHINSWLIYLINTNRKRNKQTLTKHLNKLFFIACSSHCSWLYCYINKFDVHFF